MQRVCGGCEGKGAHWRWCPEVVGRSASLMGQQAQQANSLGDSVGPNNMGASNLLWQAAEMLRRDALARAAEWRGRNGAPRRDGKKV